MNKTHRFEIWFLMDEIKVQTLSSWIRQLRTQQTTTKVQQGQAAPESKVSQQLRVMIRQARMVAWLPKSVPTVPSPVWGEQSRSAVSQEFRALHKSVAEMHQHHCSIAWPGQATSSLAKHKCKVRCSHGSFSHNSFHTTVWPEVTQLHQNLDLRPGNETPGGAEEEVALMA